MARHQFHPALPEDDYPKLRRVFSVEDFLHWAGISRFLFYKLVKEGKILPSKIGRRTVILPEERDRFTRELPRMGGASPSNDPDEA